MSQADASTALFASQDVNGDGFISIREFERFRRQAMTAMDANGDARVDRAEWTEFDPGFLRLAQENMTEMKLEDAKGAIFASLDTSADGYLSNDEMTAGLFRGFLDADGDDDGRLTKVEMDTLPLVAAFTAALMK